MPANGRRDLIRRLKVNRLKAEIQLNYIHSLIPSVIRLTTGPKLFHSEFSTEGDVVFPLSGYGTIISLRSLIICLRLIPRLPVNSILPATFSTRT